MPEIKEIKIKKVLALSPKAQDEVNDKLNKILEQTEDFNFQGYAKVSYTENSPLSVLSVDPIEGTVLNFFSDIMNKIEGKKDGAV